MPELPEVEHARRLLRRAMKGERIARVLARRPALRYPLPPDFAARLTGQTVRDVRRRAKYLLADLSAGDVLLMHLGMSGDFRVTRDPGAELWTHDHVVFDMAHGRRVIFNDPRRFGFMTIVDASREDAHPALAALGPEPLDAAFTADVLAPALARRRASSLKAALSDQRVVAGLGNIYVCEALHLARLSPTRRAATLATRAGAPTPAAEALVAAIRQVLREAIASRHQLYAADRFRVYDREGERCPRRGCGGTVRRIVQVGRSTFFCRSCQR